MFERYGDAGLQDGAIWELWGIFSVAAWSGQLPANE
jgi:hypothetical protein